MFGRRRPHCWRRDRLLFPPRQEGYKLTVAAHTREPPVKTAADSANNNVKQFPPKTRVQLDLTPRAMLLLTELKDKTEASTYAEVIKAAMKLYDGLITETEKGNEFLIRDKDGRVSEFRMFL